LAKKDAGDPQDGSFWEGVLRQNAGWVIVVIGLAASVVTFILGGTVWLIIGLFVLLLIGILALARTGLRERRLRVTAESRVKELQALTPELLPQLKTESPAPDATETAIAQAEVKAAAPVAPSEAEPPQTESAEKLARDAGEDDLNQAIAAAFAGDAEKVDRLLTGWLTAPDNDEDPLWRPSLRLQLLALAGKQGAVGELAALADTNPSSSTPVDRLAYALEQMGETRQAADELRTRIPKVGNGRRGLVLHEARLRRKLGEYDVGLRLCREALGDPDAPPRAVTLALVEEGYCLEGAGMRDAAFSDFERALEREPSDQDVRFHLAYEYSQDGLAEPALAHYLILAGHNPTAMTLNNLGAALTQFGLPMLGTQRYKEAAAKGNALASGNLAMRLLEVGFVDEAAQRIAEGEALERTNRMVVAAASRIDAEQRAEQIKLDELERVGANLREIYKQVRSERPAVLPAGHFKTPTGKSLTLDVANGVSAGKTEDGEEITLKLKGPLLDLGWKGPGLFAPTYTGKAIFREGRISGYFRNAKGENIGFVADSTDPAT